MLAAEILRVRAVLLVPWLTLVLGIGFDLVALALIGGGPLWLILVTRAGLLAFNGGMAWHLHHRAIEAPRLTRALIVGSFPVSALAQTIFATMIGGLLSPYLLGLFIVLICQAVAVAMPWRRATMLSGVTTWIYPVGLLIGCAISPELRAQLEDPPTRDLFLLQV